MILCSSQTYDNGALFDAFATVVSLLTTTMPDFDEWFVLKMVAAILYDDEKADTLTMASISQSASRGRRATSTSDLKVADSQ